MLARSILAKYCMQEARFNFTSFHHSKNATNSAQYFWLVVMQSKGTDTFREVPEERVDSSMAHIGHIQHVRGRVHFYLLSPW